MNIQFQIVERTGHNLKKALTDAMRTGSLETLIAEQRGKRIRHISDGYPGWMTWNYDKGVITCRVLSPKKPGSEWKLFHAFLGRLADRFADQIHSINIQFIEEQSIKPGRKKPRG